MNNYYNCIYMYINNINGHKYVGQAIDFNRRHRQHISASYNKNNGQYNTHFHCAIRKYGEENFDIVILKENLSSQCLLNLYECYYIDKYKCLSKENYNIASGGSNGNVFEGKTEEEMDIIRKNMSNSWKNKTDEEKNIKKNKISIAKKEWWNNTTENEIKKMIEKRTEKMIGEKNPNYGKKLEYISNMNKELKSKKIIQLKDGEIIKIWDSIHEIKNVLGFNRSPISNVCQFNNLNQDKNEWYKTHKNRPSKTAYGFEWKYLDDKKED